MREVLKSYRVLHGLTQAGMAENLGISIRAYQNKEQGLTDFKVKEINAIKDMFALTADQLEEIFFTQNV